MLFAAGEIGERKRKLGVADHAQITLDSSLDNDARLGVAFRVDAEDVGQAGEIIDDGRGFFDETRKSMSPMISLQRRRLPAVLQRITSGCCAGNPATAPKRATHCCRDGAPRTCAASDALADIGLCLFAEARQSRRPFPFAGLFELLDRGDPQLVVKRLDLLWSEAGNFEQLAQPAGRDALRSS